MGVGPSGSGQKRPTRRPDPQGPTPSSQSNAWSGAKSPPDHACFAVHGSGGSDQNGSVGGRPNGRNAVGTQIETAGRNIPFRHRRLMTRHADRQPPVRVERPWSVHGPPNHSGQRLTHLGGTNALRQFAAKRGLRQQVKRAAPVRERSPEQWITPVRSDETFLDRCVPLGARVDRRDERFPRRRAIANRREHVDQHRMNHEAVVVVPMEQRSIAVRAVAFVPLFVLTDGVVHSHRIPGLAEQCERGFDRRGKQQPVVERRADAVCRSKGGRHGGAHGRWQRPTERIRCAQHRLREERCVHERLTARRDIHVGR